MTEERVRKGLPRHGTRRRSLGRDAARPTGREQPYPRVVIAGTASGVGKTSVTAGLLAALASGGTRVGAFKCGPDFLDPQVLRGAARTPSVSNLDRWLTRDATLLSSFRRHGGPGPGDVNVVEGVMGVLDTCSWGTSTADVAAVLLAPMLLVVDAAAAAESVVLQVRGAQELLPEGGLGGVIVNRVGRGWHSAAVRQTIERKCRVPVVGSLPWSSDIAMPEQPLGLFTPRTRPGASWSRTFRSLAEWAREGLDLNRIRAIASTARPLPEGPGRRTEPTGQARGCLAVASDPAFCFTYPENLEVFTDRGLRVEAFSPVDGDSLPPNADAVYLPGGYPESHAGALSRNEGLRRELRGWVGDGRPLWAECGGMMYLLDRLVTVRGRSFRMVGAFRGSTAMQPRLAGFGYGTAHLRRTSLLGPRGQQLRGHVYHHSRRATPVRESWAWRYVPRSGGPAEADGLCRGRSAAGYLHLRLDEYPRIAETMMLEGRE